MQGRGKSILTGYKNEHFSCQKQEKNISSEKNIFIHSYNSERKQLNLELFNLFITFVCTYISF